MREKFDKVLLEFKNKKPQGVDEIPAEDIKICRENINKITYVLIQKIHETGQVPRDFT